MSTKSQLFPQQGLAAKSPQQATRSGAGLSVEEVSCGNQTPDPTLPALRSQLLSRLGVRQTAKISPMARAGGQNAGVWVVEDGSVSLVLKLIRNVDLGVRLPTESERFQKLAASAPAMLTDPSMTFPQKMFRVKGTVPQGSYDLLVMPKAAGERLSDVISILWARGQKSQVMSIVERAGAFLKEFHIKYANKQHCDFQASNLFFEEATGKFTMVDLADIGQQAIISETDFDHFIGGLRILSKSFGLQFFQESQHAFQAGYNSTRS